MQTAVTQEECLSPLEHGQRDVLAVHGEDGYPYALPMDFIYMDNFPDPEKVEKELQKSGTRVQILELVADHMTGKRVKEK